MNSHDEDVREGDIFSAAIDETHKLKNLIDRLRSIDPDTHGPADRNLERLTRSLTRIGKRFESARAVLAWYDGVKRRDHERVDLA